MISRNRVLISFYSFYYALKRSFLYHFDLKFRNLIFNLEGQNSLFTQNLDTIFNMTKTHQKCTFWKLDISPNDFVFFVDFIWSLDCDILSPAISQVVGPTWAPYTKPPSPSPICPNRMLQREKREPAAAALFFFLSFFFLITL